MGKVVDGSIPSTSAVGIALFDALSKLDSINGADLNSVMQDRSEVVCITYFYLTVFVLF